MTAPDGRPTNAVFGFTSMLLKMVADLKPEGVVVAFDLGKPAFRTEALAAYKVHRPPTAPDLKAQFPMVKELLGALGVPIVEVEGWEGDDVLGTLSCQGTAEGLHVLLVTGDKDALQLVTDDVQVVSTKKGITDIVVYDRDAVVERYGVTPEQVPDFLGLKGDTSDNIPGVAGVGEKTAAKLLQEYGTLDAVLELAKSRASWARTCASTQTPPWPAEWSPPSAAMCRWTSILRASASATSTRTPLSRRCPSLRSPRWWSGFWRSTGIATPAASPRPPSRPASRAAPNGARLPAPKRSRTSQRSRRTHRQAGSALHPATWRATASSPMNARSPSRSMAPSRR